MIPRLGNDEGSIPSRITNTIDPRPHRSYIIGMKLLATIALFFIMLSQPLSANGTIVLVVDTSSSMDAAELDLQYDGYSAALSQLAYLENVNIEVVLFNDDPVHIASGNRSNAITAFDNELRLGGEFRGLTCLANALIYVEAMLPTLPTPVIVDISGDGEANCDGYVAVSESLDRLAAQGVRVNTLLVASDPMSKFNPREVYQNMTRNNGFMIEANGFYDFENALFEKLTLEIAQLTQVVSR